MAFQQQTETVADMVARVTAEKAAKQAEMDAMREESDREWKEEQAAKAKAKVEAQQAAQEKQRAEAAVRFDREHKEPTRATWLANGGTEQEFAAAWPSLRQNLLGEISRQQAERRRAAVSAQYRQNF
jgi:hypothetical protein